MTHMNMHKKGVAVKRRNAAPKRAVPARQRALKPQTRRTAQLKRAQNAGTVTHYYGAIGVGIVKFRKPVKVGALVEFRGATTNFTQTLDSMQYDHKPVASAPRGKEVGIKVKARVREGDELFLVS